VARLATGDASVLELAEPFQISLPAISRHIKVLERAGLVARARDAQKRPCRLRASTLHEVTAWTEHTRRAWEERFDRFEDYLHQLQAKTPIPTDKTIKPKPQEKARHGRKKR
jgi:DNA-binding transcriptional ArsR family regulator